MVEISIVLLIFLCLMAAVGIWFSASLSVAIIDGVNKRKEKVKTENDQRSDTI